MFAEQLNSEILDSKIEIEQLVNKSVNHFAYPNGDYSVREVDLVKKSGYRSARTINSNVIRISDDLYELPNIGISDDATINVLCLQISRLPIRVKNLIKNGRFNGIYSPINIEL
jgi:peptidoglycan/xylan/chitin deacetylase (PgdA/CDA1 family)